MKKLIYLLSLLIAFTAISINTQAQKSDVKNFTAATGDSINHIYGLDTTLYYAVRGNTDWSITVATDSIKGAGGKAVYGGNFQIVCSDDGTRWFNYPNKYQVIYNAHDSTVYDKTYGTIYSDTISTNNRYIYTDTSFPYSYIGIKTTKGTCSGKIYSTFVMKKPE